MRCCDSSFSQSLKTNGASRLHAFSGADSLLDKIGETSATVAPAVSKVVTPAATATVEKVVYATPSLPVETAAAPVAKAAAVATSVAAPAAADVSMTMPDVPMSVVGVAVVAVLAIAALTAGDDEESESSTASSSSSSSSSSGESVDVSIPYDAAARLAYEEAGQPGSFDSFNTKYLKQAVADVKAKQKK